MFFPISTNWGRWWFSGKIGRCQRVSASPGFDSYVIQYQSIAQAVLTVNSRPTHIQFLFCCISTPNVDGCLETLVLEAFRIQQDDLLVKGMLELQSNL
jgi:hypothetical protein